MDPDYPARIKEEVEGKERICRLCACSTQLIIPIFDGEGLENNLPEKFDKHLPIQIAPHDTLPVQVCFQCASTVLSWHELTMTCVKAEKKLIAMFGANQVLSTDPQLSPADSRGDDAVICDDSITSLKEQENVGIQPETVEIMHEPESLIEDQDIREEGVHSSEPQEGDHTRCLKEVTLEDISDKLMYEIHNREFSDTSCSGNHCNSAHPQSQSSFPVINTACNCQNCFIPSQTDGDKASHFYSDNDKNLLEGELNPDISQNCQFCGRFFRHSSILKMHVVSCGKLLGKSSGNEDYCDYETLDESFVFDELKMVQALGRKDHRRKCVAKRGFRSSSGPSSRFKPRMHSISRNLFSCKFCGCEFDSKFFAEAHMLDCFPHKEPVKIRQPKVVKEGRVSCAYCIKSFSTKHDAVSHVKKSHPTKTLEFLTWLQKRKIYLKGKLCSICDKIFDSSAKVSEHMENVHKEKNFSVLWSCEMSSTECRSEIELVSNLVGHSGPEKSSETCFGASSNELPAMDSDVQIDTGEAFRSICQPQSVNVISSAPIDMVNNSQKLDKCEISNRNSIEYSCLKPVSIPDCQE